MAEIIETDITEKRVVEEAVAASRMETIAIQGHAGAAGDIVVQGKKP